MPTEYDDWNAEISIKFILVDKLTVIFNLPFQTEHFFFSHKTVKHVP